MRRFKGLVVGFGLFFLMASPLQAASPKTTLTVWEFSANEDLLRRLLRPFEEAHPEIEIEIQQLSWEHGLEKIIIAIAAGNSPDIIELGTDWVAKFIERGLLVDLTEKVEDLHNDYYLWRSVTEQNRIYGVPWLAGTRLLFYNKDLFQKAGLDSNAPPATWDALLEAARRIHRPQEGIYGFSIFVGEPYSPWQEFLPFAWGNGAMLFTEDRQKTRIDEAPMVEALSYYQSLKPYSLIHRQAQVNTLFAEGKVGMQISGAWNLRLIPKINPKLSFGTALLPKPGLHHGKPAAFAGGEIFAILKNSRHPEEALALIRFLTNRKNTLEVVRIQQNVIPALKMSPEAVVLEQDVHQRHFFEQMRTAVSPPSHPAWPEIQEHLTEAIEKVIVRNTPPQKALTAAQDKIAPLLTPRKNLMRSFNYQWGLYGSIGLLLILGAFLILRRRQRFPLPASISSERRVLWIFLSPWLLTLFFFWIYPFIHSVVTSFSEYDLLTGKMVFSGFQNYTALFQDKTFHRALWQTFLFALGTIPTTLALSLFTAILLHRKLPCKRAIQAGIFLPASTSVIVIATLFVYLYSPHGPVNTLLSRMGLPFPQPSWLVNERWALPSIMLMNIWSNFGYYMILILVGLQTIPASLYESAAIDGATEWQRLIHITLPQLRPILLFVVVIHTIYSLRVFPEILTMTQGGPLGATKTAVYYLYETGFQKFQIGMASAVGYLLFIVTMLFSFTQMRLLRMKYTSPGEAYGE